MEEFIVDYGIDNIKRVKYIKIEDDVEVKGCVNDLFFIFFILKDDYWVCLVMK